MFCLDLISDTESDSENVFDDIDSDEDKNKDKNEKEDDYVYCTSIALSPINLPVLEPVEEVLEKRTFGPLTPHHKFL